MYLWRKSATPKWRIDNGGRLRTVAGDQLAIIERPNRKRLQLEIASISRAVLQELEKQFGGRIQKLPRDWLKRSLRRKTKPIKVGSRRLIIPAGAAFGTGEHATTAVSLRLLENISREPDRGWSVVDLGTGSGILALAAKFLGAKRVIGIDNDPIAVRTAKQNARLNRIRGVQFRVADVRRWKPRAKIDIVTANLFSELVIEILPKVRHSRWLILSGILREQERDLTRALRRNKIAIIEERRRGKWVAILAICSGAL
jgi:ribosomal protein L11 methyltransferase